jgi:hypothetical protein
MRTDVISNRLNISKQGEQHYFSLLLPDDVGSIAGVEMGILLLSDMGTSNRQTAGTIKLQAVERPNICFCADVKIGLSTATTPTLGFANSPENLSLLQWVNQPFVAGSTYEPEDLNLKHCSSLYGCYTDELGKNTGKDLNYSVFFHLWIQVNT